MYYLLYFYSIPYSEEIFKRTSFSFFIERVNSKAFLSVCAELPDFGLPALLPMSVFLAELPPVVQRSLQDSRPATRRPLLKKGSIRKLFPRTDNVLSMEELRTRNTGAVDFWVPVYGYRSPSPLWVFCALVHGGRHLPKALGFSAMPPTCTT